MKTTPPILAASLLIALSHGAAAQIKVSPWQMHEGTRGLIPFETPTDELKKAALDQAKPLPAQNDSGWIPAPETGGIVDIDRPSKIPGGQGFKQLDFLYFQTAVDIPKGTNVDKFQVEFDSVDDGARVWIFNSKHPEGYFEEKNDIIAKSTKAEVDFGGEAVAGEVNRIVVAQYDLCDPGNTIKGINVIVGGKPVPTNRVDAPFVANSRGDVHMRTPDGLVYDFQGTGEFLCFQSDDKQMIVQSRQEVYPTNPQTSINTAAAILLDGHKFEFYLKPEFRWFVNGKEEKEPTGPGGMGFKEGTKMDYEIINTNQKRFTIFRGDRSAAARIITYGNSHMDVLVRRDSNEHTYQGMFGNSDQDAWNDMTLRDGEIVTPPASIPDLNRFTDSWRLEAGESLFTDAERNKTQEELAKSPHTDVQIPKAEWDAAEQVVKAAGITTPLAIRNATYDIALTGDKSFIESAKVDDAMIKALPPKERMVVAGDQANELVVAAENQAATAAAGNTVADGPAPVAGLPTMADIVASGATWEGNWDWAADDNHPENHSKLSIKSETEFTYVYAGTTHNLTGKLGFAGGNPKNPVAVGLTLPNGDELRFAWESLNEIEGQFWSKGTKAGVTQNNPPQATAKLARAPK